MTDVSPATTTTGLAPAAREGWSDTLKGVLILLVVLWHVVMKSYLEIDWQLGLPIPGTWGLFSDLVWPMLMPLFLLVSGYFAANAFLRPWSVVFRSRVLRFLYLYLLWSLIHMAALWAFPDFPTLVPRGIAEFVESVTISPPNTWYLYALALYFLVAKALHRVPAWLLISLACALSIVVSAGWLEIVSNRGSLLYNFTFFLLGLHFAPQIRRFVARSTLPGAAACVFVYLLAFGAMRLTGTETVPGVWLGASLIGVVAGLAAAPMLWRVPRLGAGLSWLGRRSLPIYLIHMPLLAIADLMLAEALSDARVAVQLVAAVVLPVILTALLVAVCLVINRILKRDGFAWLFDLPRIPRSRPAAFTADAGSSADPGRSATPRILIPWRTATVVSVLAGCVVVTTAATAIPGCGQGIPAGPTGQPGDVSIGATGDLLIHDIGHAVPADGGADHFDAVRPWFTQDLVTGNLEQVIADDTGYDKCGSAKDCLAFRSAPATAGYFAGFDLLNMANNHTSDFGPEGYTITRQNLAANGIRAVGERNEIVCTDIRGTTVAVIGFAPYQGTNRVTDLRHVRKVVAAAAATADIVVVHAHMGAEGADANQVTPGPEQMFGENRGDVTAFSHAAVDAGADLVIGHGPHSLRGMEFYRGRLIAYSLGNFGGGGVFGAEQATRYGVYLDVSLRPDGGFIDGRLRSVGFTHQDGRPMPDPAGQAARLVDEFSRRDFPKTAPVIGTDGTISPHDSFRRR